WTAKLASRLFTDSVIITSPRDRRAYRAMPTTKSFVHHGAMLRWLKRRESARRDEIVSVAPHTSRETSQASSAAGGRLHHVALFDGNAKPIGLKLHEPFVHRRAAVDTQPLERRTARLAHTGQYLGGSVCHRLECCARQVRTSRSAREADDCAACVR